MRTEPPPPSSAARGEHWWPIAAVVLLTAGMHVSLPTDYRVHPSWLVPAVLAGLMAILVVGDAGRIDEQKGWLRVLTQVLIACITVANLVAAGRLVRDILTDRESFADDAAGLLGTGTVVWLTNIIAFGLWYWSLDGGGAAARAQDPGRDPAFDFPEMTSSHVRQGWIPQFVDYLSLGFWTATAFSPADVSPLKAWAKLLMMSEAFTSIAIASIVIARAINVL